MTTRILSRSPISRYEAVTAFNLPVFQSYARISGAVGQQLGPRYSALFAHPEIVGDDIVWSTDLPGAIRTWHEMDPAERTALDPVRRQLDRTFAEFITAQARAGINTQQGNLAHLLQSALIVPGSEYVFVVGETPVLAFWGFRRPGEAGIAPLGEILPAPPLVVTPPAAAPRRLWPLLALLLLALLGVGIWKFWPHKPEPQQVAAELPAPPPPPLPAPVPPPPPVAEEPPPPPASPPPAPEPPPPEPPPPPPPEPAPVVVAPPPPPPPPVVKPPPPKPPPVRPPPPPPQPVQRPADTHPCNEDTASGGQGVTRIRHFLGNKPGMVTVLYDMFTVPDDLRVLYQGREVAHTNGYVSYQGAISFDWHPPPGQPADAYVVEVVVTGGTAAQMPFSLFPVRARTQWKYRLNCPR